MSQSTPKQTPGQILKARIVEQAGDLFDGIAISVLADVDPTNWEFAKRMFIEGYTSGFADGGLETAEHLGVKA